MQSSSSLASLLAVALLNAGPTFAQTDPGNELSQQVIVGETILGSYGLSQGSYEANCEIGPIQVTPTEVSFYESTCTFTEIVGANAASHISDVTCRGEGNEWRDVLSIRTISNNMLEVHSRANNHAEMYTRCPTQNGDGAITPTDLDEAMLCDATSPQHWVVIIGSNPRPPEGENDLSWSNRLVDKVENCGEWNWVIDDTTAYTGRKPNITFGFLRGFSNGAEATAALDQVSSCFPDAYIAKTCRSYLAD